MQIVMAEKYACVFTPYNQDFVKKIKGIGGTVWNGHFWRVPAGTAAAVREVMRDVYGYDDTMGNETVTLKVRSWRRPHRLSPASCCSPRHCLTRSAGTAASA